MKMVQNAPLSPGGMYIPCSRLIPLRLIQTRHHTLADGQGKFAFIRISTRSHVLQQKRLRDQSTLHDILSSGPCQNDDRFRTSCQSRQTRPTTTLQSPSMAPTARSIHRPVPRYDLSPHSTFPLVPLLERLCVFSGIFVFPEHVSGGCSGWFVSRDMLACRYAHYTSTGTSCYRKRVFEFEDG